MKWPRDSEHVSPSAQFSEGFTTVRAVDELAPALHEALAPNPESRYAQENKASQPEGPRILLELREFREGKCHER